MLYKCTILGLILLLAGGAAYGWLYRQTQIEQQQARSLVPINSTGLQEYVEKYGRWYQLSPEQQNLLVLEIDKERKSKSTDQLAREQQARLHADLDKLAAGQMNAGDIADFLYGPGWKDQVEQYKQRNEQRETAQTVSVVCLSIGGIVFGGCLIVWLVWLIARIVRVLRRRSSAVQNEAEPGAAELTDIELHEAQPQPVPEAPVPEPQPKQRRKVLARPETVAEPAGGLDDFFVSVTTTPGTGHPAAAVQDSVEESSISVLLGDEQSQESEWSPQSQWSWHGAGEPAATRDVREQPPTKPHASRPIQQESASTRENPLKEHADDLQRQVAEFKQVAQNVQQATRAQAEPLNNTLKELAQQVSAIREYAASQQDRVEKLQDGYDWGIIRTFCLRVIRCIDNLEGRLAELPKGDGAAAHLEEVKDELLFALESSGVEQFRPEINSDYHGQEKLAETFKEKQPAKKPEQAGKIAKVIRPGYRYMVDDENFRVVRTAQVKLYG